MNRKRRTVLLVCEYGTLNGGERSLLAAIDQLSTDEFRLVALAPAEGGLAESLAARNIEVRSLELYGSTGVRIELQRVRGQLATHIAEVRPDLIHANSVSTSRWTGPVASQAAVERFGLEPVARIHGMATAGVEPRIMGIGPVPATRKLLGKLGMTLEQMDVIELNEAFAAQVLACARELGIADDDPRLNPNGGAIALGHPLGMSGARIVASAANELVRNNQRFALCTMCIGVGQGIAIVIERV